MATEYSTTASNARMQAVADAAGAAAYLQIWKGTVLATPTTTGTATDLMASLAMQTSGIETGTGSIANGVLTCGAISDDTSAAYSGTPTFARISTTESGLASGVAQFTSGVSSGDLSFDGAFVAGGTISVSSLTLTDASLGA